MLAQFKDRIYEFTPWRPADGPVMTRTFAFDSETTRIHEGRSWVTPAYVLGAACDGRKGVFLTRDNVEAFFRTHQNLAFIAHNAAFDLKVVHSVAPNLDIYRWIEEDRVWDTRLLHQLLVLGTKGHPDEGKGRATLDRLSGTYLKEELAKDVRDKDGDLVRLSYAKWLNRDPREIEQPYLEYLALDVLATLGVYIQLRRRLAKVLRRSSATWGFVSRRWLRKQVQQWGPQTHHIQLKASIVLDSITASGLHIDTQRAGQLTATLTEELAYLKRKLGEQGYIPDQKGSDKSLQSILTRVERKNPKLHLPRTPSGKYATRKEVLEDVASHVPFADLLLQYRAAAKLKSTFVDKLATGIIRPTFKTIVRSGRTSSFGEINAQNLPRKAGVRECFIPSSGRVFITADYSTIEMATLAQACVRQFGWKSAMAKAINSVQDLHRLVAARVVGKSASEVTKDERSKAKPINFGKPGGMGDSTLRTYAKLNYGIELAEEEVESLSTAWFESFPEMRKFLASESEQIWLRIATELGMTRADYAAHSGDRRFLSHPDALRSQYQPCKFLGGMCLKAISEESPTTKNGRPYSDAEIDYFWHKVEGASDQLPTCIQLAIRKRRPCYPIKRALRSHFDRSAVFTLTGRLRGNTGYCQRHNTVFQGLAADGAKLALWKLWRAGFRIVNFIHDEFLIEIPANVDLLDRAETIKKLMIAGMKAVVPDIAVNVEYAAMTCWSKEATKIFDDCARLVPWKPEPGLASGANGIQHSIPLAEISTLADQQSEPAHAA